MVLGPGFVTQELRRHHPHLPHHPHHQQHQQHQQHQLQQPGVSCGDRVCGVDDFTSFVLLKRGKV
jgi:hypothetical protein